jgi:hypothetical protein
VRKGTITCTATGWVQPRKKPIDNDEEVNFVRRGFDNKDVVEILEECNDEKGAKFYLIRKEELRGYVKKKYLVGLAESSVEEDDEDKDEFDFRLPGEREEDEESEESEESEEDGPLHDVEEIRDHRGTGARRKFLVKWEGLDFPDPTWEPLSCVKDCLAFQAYMLLVSKRK